ncbi:MAG: class I SAM-dependent RNA methyltransferase [Actinobacteria bacterium]|nr:class I SAM-dependent RNA methyltransferase [Actinomycetota bacterium]
MDAVVTAQKMAAGGDAIARLEDGRVVFVDGALPGEQVRVRLGTMKKDFARGVVTEVLDPSPHRVAPPCPELANGCGGCGWQHAQPSAQLTMKTDIVVDALRRTAKLAEPTVSVGGSVPEWGYRTTMRLAVDLSGRVGLRGANSHHVVPLAECPVAHPSLSALIAPLRVRGAAELTLRVSVSTGEATALATDPRGRAVDATIDGLPDHVAVGSSAALHEHVAGARLRVSAPSFFQSGPLAAELLVRTVGAACGHLLRPDEPFLDAYGGIGLFAATLGGADVMVVESSPSATVDAAVNVPHARVMCEPFEQWTPVPVRLAVVDPARAGLGRDAVDVLAATGAERVALVSCDPVSLARDAVLLAAHGYAHHESVVLDLFPNTPHVEAVTVFERS